MQYNDGNMQTSYPFQRAAGRCEVVWQGLRLTPEYKPNEWALTDANKSGTAEASYAFVSCMTGDEGFFVAWDGLFL